MDAWTIDPAQDGAMTAYPESLVPPGGVAPVPRRLRGLLGASWVFDTERALYVWEFPPYPQYYIPLADIDAALLVDEQRGEHTSRGTAARWGLRVGETARPGAVLVHGADAPEQLRATARFDWTALDAWFEEDEQVYVHPRNPYARVDAVRSSRTVRVELNGVVLAEAASSVVVFETGLPPRYYLDRTVLHREHLEPSGRVTACPYKGETSQYWSARLGEVVHPDLAWSYSFPTGQLLPIAGLIAFYNEKVDLFLDGKQQPRPRTPFG
jgi:uncharacterized protein (DUF427 family)